MKFILLIFFCSNFASATPEESKLSAECTKKGGKWMGSISGRGRLTGCNERTKDEGKVCSRGEDCESVCVQNKCFGWQKFKGCGMFKGRDQAMCVE